MGDRMKSNLKDIFICKYLLEMLETQQNSRLKKKRIYADIQFLNTYKKLKNKSVFHNIIAKDEINNTCPRTTFIMSPLYGDPQSYSGYVNQDPRNEMYQHVMHNKKRQEVHNLEDYQKKYFEDDGYTLKNYINKTAYHGTNTRTNAIVYINGEFLEGNSHPNMVQQWLIDNGKLLDVVNNFIEEHPELSEEDKKTMVDNAKEGYIPDDILSKLSEFDREKLTFANIPYAIAHRLDNSDGMEIFIDTNVIANISLDELVKEFHKNYPKATLFDDNTSEILYAPENRSKNKDDYSHKSRRILTIFVEIDVNISDEQLLAKLNNNILKEVDGFNKAKFEVVDLDSKRLLKVKLFVESSLNSKEIEKQASEILKDYINSLVVKKIAGLVKKSGINNRTRALVYIDGNVIEGGNHPDLITKYLKDTNKVDSAVKAYFKNQGYSEEQIKLEYEDMEEENEVLPYDMYMELGEYERKNIDFDLPYAAADYIRTNKIEKIRILTDFLQHVSLNQVVDAFHDVYPDAVILDYDTNEILYKPDNVNMEETNLEDFYEKLIIKVNMRSFDFDYDEFYMYFKNEIPEIVKSIDGLEDIGFELIEQKDENFFGNNVLWPVEFLLECKTNKENLQYVINEAKRQITKYCEGM